VVPAAVARKSALIGAKIDIPFRVVRAAADGQSHARRRSRSVPTSRAERQLALPVTSAC
jgi:hypothetical protein